MLESLHRLDNEEEYLDKCTIRAHAVIFSFSVALALLLNLLGTY